MSSLSNVCKDSFLQKRYSALNKNCIFIKSQHEMQNDRLVRETRTMAKKIIYTPGIITMIILPLISIYYFYINGAFIQYRVFEIYMPKEDQKTQIDIYKKLYHFKEFKLTSNNYLNNKLITQVDSLLHLNKSNLDTIHGINIYIENDVKYDYFIQVLNLLNKHNYKSYLIEDNHIFTVWNIPVIHN